MKNLIKPALGALAMLLSAGAWAQADAPVDRPERTNGEMPRGDDMRRPKAHKIGANDKDFIKEAARGGLTEVEIAKLGVKKGASQQVKDFAQRMLDDHTQVNTQLEQVVTRMGFELKASIDSTHQRKIDALNALKGSKFDAAFIKAMVGDHEKTIELFKKEAKDGEAAQLREFAAKTLPALEEHLKMARELSRTRISSR